MNKYSEFVASRIKPGQDIVSECTPWKAHLLHMAVGIAGEAGELLDAVKKAVIYNKELDKDNVIEELGDLEFYMEGLRQAIWVKREEILERNVRKLSKRYEEGYTDAEAHERKDKQGDLFEDGEYF